MADLDLGGFWQSKYSYHSDSRNADFEDKHVVKVHQRGKQLVVESVPNSESYLILRLTVDEDNVVTGSWEEHTSKEGHYKGAIYHGAVQVVLSKDLKHMKGKWIGISSDATINDGTWEFSYIGKELDH